MKQKTIELVQTLIRRPSISPNDEGCQQLIAERLEKLDFQIEWMPFNDTLNLWAKHGSGEPVIAFAGHTDVVPTGDETQWTYPPFSAEIVDDMLLWSWCGRYERLISSNDCGGRRICESQSES